MALSRHLKGLLQVAIRDEAGYFNDGVMVGIQPCEFKSPEPAATNHRPC